MKSNNHYIWDEYKHSASYVVALSYLEQIKTFAKDHGYNPKEVRLLEKRTLTESNIKHAECAIEWKTGPNDWAYHVEISPVHSSVCIEPLNGSNLTFYSI